MLQLRPSCENCNEPLPPESLEARICSFECTFCVRCVEDVIENVCPNCVAVFVRGPFARPGTGRTTTTWGRSRRAPTSNTVLWTANFTHRSRRRSDEYHPTRDEPAVVADSAIELVVTRCRRSATSRRSESARGASVGRCRACHRRAGSAA